MLNNEAAEAPEVLMVSVSHECDSGVSSGCIFCCIQATVAVNRLLTVSYIRLLAT